MFSYEKNNALEQFKKYINVPNEDHCLEYEEKLRVTDAEVISHLKKLDLVNINELHQLEKVKRNQIIKTVKSIDGVTIRQLSRITRMSKSVIDRI